LAAGSFKASFSKTRCSPSVPHRPVRWS
jgi:hypothetical protein